MCKQPSCIKMKRVLRHTRDCKLRMSGNCTICKQFLLLCYSHAKSCTDDKCPVPICARIKKNLQEQRAQSQMRQNTQQGESWPVRACSCSLMYVLRNLRICAISRLRCVFSESRACALILRLSRQSRDCIITTCAQSLDHVICIHDVEQCGGRA